MATVGYMNNAAIAVGDTVVATPTGLAHNIDGGISGGVTWEVVGVHTSAYDRMTRYEISYWPPRMGEIRLTVLDDEIQPARA